jgi:hypothetical protein
MRDAFIARRDLDKVWRGDLPAQVNHHAQRVSHHRQICKDACRPKQRVAVTRDYLHAAKSFHGCLESPVEIDKRRRPVLEQRIGTAYSTGVALIDLTKDPVTLRACPSHKGFLQSERQVCRGAAVTRDAQRNTPFDCATFNPSTLAANRIGG